VAPSSPRSAPLPPAARAGAARPLAQARLPLPPRCSRRGPQKMGAAESCSSCCSKDDGSKVVSIPADLAPALGGSAAAEAAALAAASDGGVFVGTPAPAAGAAAAAAGAAKGAAAPAPGGRRSLFLRRDRQMNIGLNLDALDPTTAFVDHIVPGAVQAWNALHPAMDHLKIYDRIISVNGVSGNTDDLLTELRSQDTWDITVVRPVEIRVVVDCARFRSLGLDLKYSPNGSTLLIAELGDGAIAQWNQNILRDEGPSTMTVTRCDRIVELNGARGDAKKLLEAAADTQMLHMTILHYEG